MNNLTHKFGLRVSRPILSLVSKNEGGVFFLSLAVIEVIIRPERGKCTIARVRQDVTDPAAQCYFPPSLTALCLSV